MEGNRLLPNLSIKKIWAKLTSLQTDVNKLNSKTSKKSGAYGFYSNGGDTKNIVFSYPYVSSRHVFLIMANIAKVSYCALCLVNDFSSEVKSVSMTNLTTNKLDSLITVSACNYNGDNSKLRIKIETPANMGSNIEVLTSSGEFYTEF